MDSRKNGIISKMNVILKRNRSLGIQNERENTYATNLPGVIWSKPTLIKWYFYLHICLCSNSLYILWVDFPPGEPLEMQAAFLSSWLCQGPGMTEMFWVDLARALVLIASPWICWAAHCLPLLWSSLGAEGREDIPLAVRPYMWNDLTWKTSSFILEPSSPFLLKAC